MENKNKFYINLFLPIVLGTFVGLITNNMDYFILNKPYLAPTGIVFPIVWSILYLLMGLSYAIFSNNDTNEKISEIYYIQLGLNLLWSIIFFTLQLRFLAIIWIILLDIMVIYLTYLYYKNNHKLSAYLLIPYIIWILFATYLTIGIYILN